MKPKKSQFLEYVKIQRSGETNMWDLRFIKSISRTGLNDDICFYIMHHYKELAEEYEVEV